MSERSHPWYHTERWRKRAKAHLRDHPLCVMCLGKGRVVPATVADHIEQHHDNELKFWFGELQSLCAPHHSGDKQQQEKRGYSTEIGVDGWPIDRRHPANKWRGGGHPK